MRPAQRQLLRERAMRKRDRIERAITRKIAAWYGERNGECTVQEYIRACRRIRGEHMAELASRRRKYRARKLALARAAPGEAS